MFKTKLILGLMTCMAGVCFAEAEGSKFYHLDFVVKEAEGGKVTNSRHYWTTVTAGDHPSCSIRTGSKVPVSSGETFTYLDLGVNIDCSFVHEADGSLSLNVTADVSSVASQASGGRPVIRQNKWNGMVLVPLGKPTLIYSSDDVASKGQIQVELNATPVK